MERKKYIILMLLCTMFVLSFGQNNRTIYQAYITGDMTKWKIAMDSIESVPNKTDKDVLDLINYQYGYIAWCIDKRKMNEAKKHIKKSEALVTQLAKTGYNPSVLNAYNAAFIGFKIGIAPYKAPFIGSKSLHFAKQSVAKDSTNTLGYVQLGNIAYYTPSMFGGSKKEAMQHYVKALTLMEKQPDKLIYNWNYLNLLATIINAYMELKQYETAKYYCIKTLSVEPNFDWVKNKLYPQIKQK